MKLLTKIALAVALRQAKASRKLAQNPDLGDLIALYRHLSNGVPILTGIDINNPAVEPTPEECADASTSTGCCLWPLAFPGPDCVQDCIYDGVTEGGVTVLEPNNINPQSCAVELGESCAGCIQEADFGRTSSTRSPPEVLDAQLAEVQSNLANTLCPLYTDPAGRPVYFGGGENDDLTDKVAHALDSPLMSMAMYREVMTTGNLGIPLAPFPNDPFTNNADKLLFAARALGTAIDKTGKLTLDEMVYTNRILNLTETSWIASLGTECINVRQEVTGEPQPVLHCFLDYSAVGFPYNRQDNFANLPAPTYIPETNPKDGTFEVLTVDNSSVPTFKKVYSDIFFTAFAGSPFVNSNEAAHSVAMAADDTRAVIDYMHSWPVPADYATEPTCTQYLEYIIYNVFLSALQVPTRIKKDQAEREFFVKVGNAGRHDAEGVVLVVEAKVTTDDGTTDNSLTHYFGPSASGDQLTVLFTGVEQDMNDAVSASEPISLKSGAAMELSGNVPIELTHGGKRSTITWVATLKEIPHDTHAADNTMTQMTTLIGKSNGGRKLRGL